MEDWLQSLVPWGLDAIVWIQLHSSSWLEAIAEALTYLGDREIYFLMLSLVYWSVQKQTGVALVYLSLLSAWVNDVIKYLFSIPRPGTLDARIRVLDKETNPSFPSGHSQGAMVNWGYLAYRFRNPVFWVVAVFVILGIGLSRIVLGVHFPQDVLGGWLIGLVVLVIFVWAEPPVTRWLAGLGMAIQLALAIGVPVLLIFLHPADMEGLYPAAGAIGPPSTLVGFGVGVIMERKWVRFRVDGEWWRRGLRFLVGVTIIALLYLGPSLILPEGMSPGLETGIRFLRYTLVGWATTFLCPWLFVRLGLAEQEAKKGVSAIG
jgi:membrane-associated phospholipid phosphatase